MADKKISQLNTATTVFDADDFTIVQDGETKQANASTVKAYVKDGLSKSDVGLGNVDNTSDATKNSATATLTNKTLTSPTINGGSALDLAQLTVDGNSTLGDAAGDTLTINGTAVSIPNNLNFDSNTLFIDTANNRVGINTALPGTRLHLVSSSNPAAIFEATSAASAGVEIRDGAATPNRWWLMSGLGATTDGTFSIYDARQNVSRIAIDTFGNVGIGTSTPGAKLEVAGSANPNINSKSTGGITASLSAVDAFGGGYFGTTTNHPQMFYTNNVERMRIDSSGNVGIGVIPNNAYTACLQLSSGITFPATQVASTNANTLDDYEEGTWTPSVGGNATYTLQDAYYVKIGKVVYVTGRLLINVLGTGSASTVSGLPFVAANTFARGILSLGAAQVLGAAFFSLECEVANNTSTFIFMGRTAAGSATAQATVLANGSNLQFSGFYFTN